MSVIERVEQAAYIVNVWVGAAGLHHTHLLSKVSGKSGALFRVLLVFMIMLLTTLQSGYWMATIAS